MIHEALVSRPLGADCPGDAWEPTSPDICGCCVDSWPLALRHTARYPLASGKSDHEFVVATKGGEAFLSSSVRGTGRSDTMSLFFPDRRAQSVGGFAFAGFVVPALKNGALARALVNLRPVLGLQNCGINVDTVEENVPCRTRLQKNWADAETTSASRCAVIVTRCVLYLGRVVLLTMLLILVMRTEQY